MYGGLISYESVNKTDEEKEKYQQEVEHMREEEWQRDEWEKAQEVGRLSQLQEEEK